MVDGCPTNEPHRSSLQWAAYTKRMGVAVRRISMIVRLHCRRLVADRVVLAGCFQELTPARNPFFFFALRRPYVCAGDFVGQEGNENLER